MKKLVFAGLLLATASHAFAAPSVSQELAATYQAQLKAMASSDRTSLAQTLDEDTCRNVREVLANSPGTPEDSMVLQAITGMAPSALGKLSPCEQTAQLTIGLTQMSKASGAAFTPDSVQLLGVVEDGPARVYGVFRNTTKIREVEFTTEELVGFAKNGALWKISANSGLKSIVAALKARPK